MMSLISMERLLISPIGVLVTLLAVMILVLIVQLTWRFNWFISCYVVTKTGNKGKQKVKQHSKTALNTPILSKTTAKHLQTPEQGTKDFQSPGNLTQQQKPISTSTNIIEYLQENKSNHSENLESEETESEQREATENEKEMATVYIAKIPEFTSEDNNTSSQKWLDKVQKTGDANAGLKDKLIKKVCPHAPADLATAIRHAKNYKMAIEEANHTKLVNLTIGETSLAAEKKIDQLTKKDSGSAGSIITYQLMQQLQRTVDKPAQTIIVIADGMKKTPELKISYQGQYTIVSVICGTFNKQSEKAPVFEFEEEKEMLLTETYMALGSTSNWAEETEQEIFEKTRRWKKVWYSTPKSQKELP
ncbi:hypothetical protein G9A89_012709 [Geosiphon pyriformis]|nr:hypothetical protein G9A89_012709 [Geosiphon pyriformis]